MIKTPHPPDQHPEDLLDRVRRGEAHFDGEEQRRLQEHLASCVICEMQVHYVSGADLAAGETAGEAQLNRMALNRLMLSLDPPAGRWRGWFLARRWAQVAAGVVALSGTAAAAAAAASGWWTAHRTVEQFVPRHMVPAPGPAPRRRVAVRTATVPPLPLSADIDSPVVPPAPPGPATARPDGIGGAAHAVPSATALFERARQLRIERDWSGARNLYARLQRTYPQSRETQLSYLVLGRMFVDEGRPELAEKQFATYLARGGAAAEEALLGRATAFQQMGRRNDEAASFEALLARYPGSVYAGRAHARLRELRDAGVQRTVPGAAR